MAKKQKEKTVRTVLEFDEEKAEKKLRRHFKKHHNFELNDVETDNEGIYAEILIDRPLTDQCDTEILQNLMADKLVTGIHLIREIISADGTGKQDEHLYTKVTINGDIDVGYFRKFFKNCITVREVK